jgi:C4-dicarboxylate-specific signal transduction histidine kinase
MRRFWSLPLLRQLLIAVTLLLVPLIAAMVWAAVMTFGDRVDDLRDEAVVAATTTSVYVDKYLNGLDLLAATLSLHPAVQGLDATLAADVFRRTLKAQPALLTVALVTRDRREVARASDPDQAGAGDDDWASAAMSTGARYVSPLQTGKQRLHSVVVGYPVRNAAGEAIAALGLRMRLESIQAVFAAFPLPDGSVVTVTDQNGTILARTVDPNQYIGRRTPTSRRLEQIPKSEEIVGVDGVRRMHGNAFVRSGPWVVSVGIPMDLAYLRAGALWNRSFSVMFIGVVGWAVFAVMMSRRFVRSIHLLEHAAQRVAAGDLRPLEKVSMPSEELAQLYSAFGQMVQRLNETREALDRRIAEERQIREKLQSLQGQVIRQERLAAVGLLVSGVAHEINNPLQAILGFAELLQMQHNLPDSVKADLRLIQKESARACGIIRNLALFARQQPGKAAAVRFADVITSVAELRQRRLESEDIELVVDDRSTHHVMAVFTELQQVVLNFVVNAEQAILSSGRLPGRITVRSRDEGGRVLLEVEDTGPGVPPQDEAKLFQPFFTTKPVGQGTGLGLSVSYGIIDSMGGHMGYRRAPAGGAVFHFDLPATQLDRT